jgi:hypothetical protein
MIKPQPALLASLAGLGQQPACWLPADVQHAAAQQLSADTQLQMTV